MALAVICALDESRSRTSSDGVQKLLLANWLQWVSFSSIWFYNINNVCIHTVPIGLYSLGISFYFAFDRNAFSLDTCTHTHTQYRCRAEQIKQENYVWSSVGDGGRSGVLVVATRHNATRKKTWPCNKLIEMKTMNNGKHEENYWLIKSPIFKRFVVLFSSRMKEVERKEFCTICECPQWSVIEKKNETKCVLWYICGAHSVRSGGPLA